MSTQNKIKTIIAIASGKGGVGKSTTTVNLAAALVYLGNKVGILDADIYGPNIPSMLGSDDQQVIPVLTQDGQQMPTIDRYGIKTISAAYLVDAKTPMVWRGPMIAKMLAQLISMPTWGELDFLLIDLPPGTGDVQLTLSKQVKCSGAIVVTTPQKVALLDAQKAIEMFKKVDVPVIGLVENMSRHVCSKCGHADAIFGGGAADKIAKDYDLQVLARLPLDTRIQDDVDQGKPTVVRDPECEIAKIYIELASKL